jgi:hypothetical protein
VSAAPGQCRVARRAARSALRRRRALWPARRLLRPLTCTSGGPSRRAGRPPSPPRRIWPP